MDEVVRQEIWFDEDDTITLDQADELERNLRATGLFASIDVELRETDLPGVRDLNV